MCGQVTHSCQLIVENDALIPKLVSCTRNEGVVKGWAVFPGLKMRAVCRMGATHLPDFVAIIISASFIDGLHPSYDLLLKTPSNER